MASARHRLVRALTAIFLVGVTGACGSGNDAVTPATAPATTQPAAITPPTLGDTGPAGGKSAARWETVTTLSGTGATKTAPFDILPNAIQWRSRYSCETGTLKAQTDPPPRRPGAMIDATCGTPGEGFSIVTGSVSLNIEASAPWKMTIDQQVDTPLNEPPLPAMATGKVLSQGSFYNVEKTSKGTARLYQLADGRHALRMEDFEVNQNTDLFLWLDSATAPMTSEAAATSQYWVLGNLKSTLGSQNYEIPSNIPIDRVKSVVIWCQPVAIAYGAAALTPA